MRSTGRVWYIGALLGGVKRRSCSGALPPAYVATILATAVAVLHSMWGYQPAVDRVSFCAACGSARRLALRAYALSNSQDCKGGVGPEGSATR